MFTAEQYRAKATEYSKLAATANGPNELREFHRRLNETSPNSRTMRNGRSRITTRRCTQRSILARQEEFMDNLLVSSETTESVKIDGLAV